jgi:DNA polymerase
MKNPFMDEVIDRWKDCTKCPLHECRKKIVLGSGNPSADLLIIGEAPGEHEDDTGLPFQGESGKVLDEYLEAVKIDRQKDTYITNVVACRPTNPMIDDRTGKPYLENRQPTKVEQKLCRPRLLDTIYAVDPLLIIAIGKIPTESLLGKASLDQFRGMVHRFKMKGHYTEISYGVLPTYHPSYLLRTYDRTPSGPWVKSSEDWFKAWKLVCKLREAYLGMDNPLREEVYYENQTATETK